MSKFNKPAYMNGHAETVLFLDCGTKIVAENNTFLNHPIIKERIEYIKSNPPGSDYIADKRKGECTAVKESQFKYFREAPLVKYASGISIRKYDENRMK